MFGHKERFSLEESSGQRYGNEWGDWSSRLVRVLVVYAFGSILERAVDIFSGSSIFKVGSGINVCFWHDWWCGDGVLKDAFLDFTKSK